VDYRDGKTRWTLNKRVETGTRGNTTGAEKTGGKRPLTGVHGVGPRDDANGGGGRQTKNTTNTEKKVHSSTMRTKEEGWAVEFIKHSWGLYELMQINSDAKTGGVIVGY